MSRNDSITRRGFLHGLGGLGGSLALTSAGLAAGRLSAADSPAAAPGGTKPAWEIGCYTRPWEQYDFRVALDAISEAGFKHAGLMTAKGKGGLVISTATTPEEAQQVAAELRKRGLDVPSVYGGGIPVAKSLKDGIAGLRKLIDNCAAVGARSLLMGGTDKDQYEAYYKAIAECCDYAAAKKLQITIKPHGGLNATGPQCRKCIQSVGHANFRLWYDPGNIFYYSDGKLDPVQDAATVDALVTGMCVKDYRPPKDVWVTPGTGKVDFAAVLARLKKGGFAGGPLVVETVFRGSPPKPPTILAEAKKARGFLEKLTGAALRAANDK